jgi:hypothetical protein
VLEHLESRSVPAVLSFDAGSATLIYTAGSGVANNLTVSYAAGEYTFHDAGETITLDPTLPAGWVSDNANTVQGPETGISAVAINTGDGNDTVAILSANEPVMVDTGTGTDQVTVGGAGNGVQGITDISSVAVTSTGGTTSLTVDDTNDTTGRSFSLDGSSVIGLAPGDITYTAGSVNALTVLGGSGGNSITVVNTAPSIPTTLHSGAGADTVSILATTGSLAVDGDAGSDTVQVGDAGSMLAVAGPVTVGSTSGTTALSLNDSSDTVGQTATITAGSVSGLAPATISFTGARLGSLSVNGGSGGNTFTVAGTPAGVTTTLHSGVGADQVNIQGTSGPLVLNGDAGGDTVNIGSTAPTLGGTPDGLAGAVQIASTTGSIALNVDDSGDPIGRDITLGNSGVTIPGIVPVSIVTADVTAMTILGGTGNNTFTLSGSITVPTTINGGPGVTTFVANGYTLNGTVVGQSPVTHDSTYAAFPGQALLVPAPGVLADDVSPLKKTLTATVVTDPTHGTLILNSDGSFTYTPDPGFDETDSFVYDANDGTLSTPATVTIVINRPTANPDNVTTPVNTPVVINVAANDTDPEGNQFLVLSSIAITTQPAHGIVSVSDTGMVTYTPNAGFVGTDTFAYTIADTHGAVSNPAVDTVIVTPITTLTAGNVTAQATGSTPVMINLLSNVTESNGASPLDPSMTTIVTAPEHGTVTVDPTTGIATYIATVTFSGTDSFTYTIADQAGMESNVGTVTVQVFSLTPTPVLVSGQENGTVLVYTPGANGQYSSSPTATLQPFGAITADVRTAAGDVNGDGIPDYIFATGPGTPFEVTVLSGAPGNPVLVAPFDPFLPAPPLAQSDLFTAGGFVSAGDFLGNGRDQIVVSPDQSGGPRISIYDMDGAAAATAQPYTAIGVNTAEVNPGSGLTRINNFLSVNADFRGGARTAVGDLNGDGVPDLAIAAGYGGGPAVLVINGTRTATTNGFTASDDLIGAFFAFNSSLRDGAYLAIGDVLGNGQQDLILGPGAGGPAEVEVLSGAQMVNDGALAAIANPVALFTPIGLGPDGSGLRVAAVASGVGDQVNVVIGAGRDMPGLAKVYPSSGFTSGSTSEPTGGELLNPFGGAILTDGIFVG